MTDITIPKEALNAAAKSAYEAWRATVDKDLLREMPHWAYLDKDARAEWYTEARAACLAMLRAWPGMLHIQPIDFEGKIILPLPTKKETSA